MFSNRVYDILKWIALVLLPALGTFLFTLSTIYGWGWGETAVGTIAAVDTFLGALLGVSTIKYNKEKDSGNENK